jgi:hypothetical protein
MVRIHHRDAEFASLQIHERELPPPLPATEGWDRAEESQILLSLFRVHGNNRLH